MAQLDLFQQPETGYSVLVEIIEPFKGFHVGDQFRARENTALGCWSLMGFDGRKYGLILKGCARIIKEHTYGQ